MRCKQYLKLSMLALNNSYLSVFVMGTCDSCDERAIDTCYQCGDTICKNHKKVCKNCDDVTCHRCGRKCPECDEWRCDDDEKYEDHRTCTMTRCGECDRTVCGGCGWSNESSSTGFICVKCN